MPYASILMSEDPLKIPVAPPVSDTPAPAPRRRRRATVVASGSNVPEPALVARSSRFAFAGMALVGLYGLFAAGAPAAVLQGGIQVGIGILLLLVPPRFRVSWVWWVAGILMLAGASMAFLPAAWFPVPAWRTALEAAGLATGSMVTIQPLLGAESLGKFAVAVAAAWYLLGHRVSDRAHLGFALTVALGIAAYGLLSMVASDQKELWPWDPNPDFGLFGNRNHTASILSVGALCGLGVLREGVRQKRGGTAGLATLAIIVCLVGVLGFSQSRAGFLLPLAGITIWLVGLGASGGRYISRRVLLTVLGFALAGVALFWWTDNTLRQRLEASWARLEQPAAPETGAPENRVFVPDVTIPGKILELRWLIYHDTLNMIPKEPFTGVGLGQFSVVFPQHRERAAVFAKCWHPESNWLKLAAEAGWITAGVTALAVIGLFVSAFRTGRQHRGWPLTLGTLLAALVVPLHGLFDVPGHHIGIALLAMLLLALTFRPTDVPDVPSGWGSRIFFRLAGAVILAAGVLWLSTTPSPTSGPVEVRTALAIEQIKTLYAKALAETNDPVAHPPEIGPDGQPIDPWEVAQVIVNKAIQTTPLEPELHYLRGLISVNYSDEEAIADQAFAVQRLLEPDFPEVPYRQGLAWMNIDPARSLTFFSEALRRSKLAARTNPGVYESPETMIQMIKSATAKLPNLAEGVNRLTAAD